MLSTGTSRHCDEHGNEAMRRDGDKVWWEGWVAVDPHGQTVSWNDVLPEMLKGYGWRVVKVQVLLPAEVIPPTVTLVATKVDEP